MVQHSITVKAPHFEASVSTARFPVNLAEAARLLKRELKTYQLLARDPRTPRSSRWLLGAAIGYALMPFDLIPDFIPVIGHLDDALIVPGLVVLALKRVPRELVEECRERAQIATSDKPMVTATVATDSDSSDFNRNAVAREIEK